MNFFEHKITLDMHKTISQMTIYVKKRDTRRKICATLTENGKVYEITGGCTAAFTATKDNGDVLYNHCDIVGNVIEYEFTEQTTNVVGKMDCELKLYDAGGGLITSPSFFVIVEGVFVQGDEVVESSEFTAFTNALREYNDIKAELESGIASVGEHATAVEGYANEVEEHATAVEGYATAVEGYATSVEEHATAVAEQATAVAGYATSVEEAKNTAAEQAQIAEGHAQVAADSATAAQTAQAVAERSSLEARITAFDVTTDATNVEQMEIRARGYAADSKRYSEEAQSLLEQVREEMGNMPGVSVVDPVNVKDLGAKGNGTDDDSEVIQQALETYNDIYFPEGIYRVKGLTITKSNKKIVGENATLKIVDNSDVLGVTSLASVGLYIVSNDPANPVSNIVIDGINFDGNGQWFLDNGRDPTDRSGDGTCIRMYNAENVTIRNCCFDNFIRRGIGSTVPNYKYDHTHFGVHGLHISDCEFNKKPIPSKYVTIPAGATYKDGTAANAGVYKVYALGNAIQLLQTGKDAYDSDIVVERCTVHKSSNYGFMFYPLKENLTVRDCTIMNCGLNTSEDFYTKADGTKVYADYGYYCRTTDYDKADHCDGGGIKLNNPHNALVERCYIYGVRGSNISVHNATKGADYTDEMLDAWGRANNVVIRNNEIVGNPDQARCGNGITVEGGDNVKIIDNKIVNHIGAQTEHKVYGNSVKFQSTKAISSNSPCFIDGNIIENTTETVGHGGLDVFEGTVSNNTIINAKNPLYAKPAKKKDIWGTEYTLYPKNLVIRGNKFILTNSNLGKYVRAADVYEVKELDVGQNVFSGFYRGLQVSTTSEDVNISDNAFYDNGRGITFNIADVNVADGGESNAHDNVDIRNNSFVKDGVEQASGSKIVWENTGNSPATKFKPTNATIDGVQVT